MNEFIQDKEFKKLDFSKDKLPKGNYEYCRFYDCHFEKGFLDNQHFVECHFEKCNLTNVNVANTQFNDVMFDTCKLVGVLFETCDPLLLNFQFKGCNLSLASFYEMKLPNTYFDDCILHQTDFTLSNLTNTKFFNCDLKNAVFERTNLKGVDFYTAFNFEIDPELNTLTKAKFRQESLIGLLKKYDIVVEH
ncbi:pentapeptide repeat-containing protein [Croceivirga thetidis]|uniref:Pentapeptide repeat-containing protein n=1 Tax=Croceivirga thetidis TaxID=2721623 RepID=A0ABX1GP81_9FLAO|nr:pentapeptide repeat-containing protein [Croceivirga thetidis]NKI30880.1 pentapeptide repeat-containing protein [Croceivirga thetidis]